MNTFIGNEGVRVLIFGGNLNNPGNSGLSCWNANNDSSNANWNIVSRSKFCQNILNFLLVSLPLGKTQYYLSIQISSIQRNFGKDKSYEKKK